MRGTGLRCRRPRPWSGTSFDQMSCDSVFVPGQAASWSMGHDDVAINDLEGLRQDTIRPIHILQPVRSGGRGHKMGADLRQQMARHLYAVHGCDGGKIGRAHVELQSLMRSPYAV